jgi:hypothetical protein
MNSRERRRQKRRTDGTDHGRAPNSSGGTTQWSQATNLPTVFIFGVEGVEDYVNKLADSLGPDCGVHTTESFCQSEACSPAEMKILLKRDWVAHNIQRVERGEEKVGLLPLVLVEGAGPFYTISLYSPTADVRKECYPRMPNTNGLSYDDLVHLWRILGGPERVFLVEEQEFCDTAGCLLEQMEAHLKQHWVDHDIRAVLAGLEFVPEPTVVLVCYQPSLLTWHLITQRDAEARQHCLELNELSKLYEQDSDKAELDPSS